MFNFFVFSEVNDVLHQITNIEKYELEKTIKKFKLVILKSKFENLFKKMYKFSLKIENKKKSFFFVFYFFMINWSSLKQINEASIFLNIYPLFKIHKNQKIFKNKQDSSTYCFNENFCEYIQNYMNDIESIFVLKNRKINLKQNIKYLRSGKVSFASMHFFLQRIEKSFFFLPSIYKMIFLTKNTKIFQNLLNMIIDQIFEEYNYLSFMLEELLERFEEMKKSIKFEILVFYENFIWKNKRMKEVLKSFKIYFKENLIEIPKIFHLSEQNKIKITDYQQVNKDVINKMKKNLSKKSYINLSERSKAVFIALGCYSMSMNNEYMCFIKTNSINRYEREIIQKKTFSIESIYTSDEIGKLI